MKFNVDQILVSAMVAECYVDAREAHWDTNPYPMWIASYKIGPEDVLRARLAPGGGLAVRLRPFKDGDEALPSIALLVDDQ